MNSKGLKTILLVEDEPITALMEKTTLEKYGYKVITAYTGEEALEIVDNSLDINLILMDINLGRGIDGTEAAEMILKNHDLPLIFLSSHTEPELVEKTERITSYGYIVKNTGETVLIMSIKMAFRLFESKIKEKALQVSNEKYRILVENQTDMIVKFDNEGRLLFVSPSYCQTFNKTQEELIGTNFMPFIHKDDCEKVTKAIENVYKPPYTGYVEERVMTQNGWRWQAWLNTAVLNKKNEVESIVAVGRDITGLKRLEKAQQLEKNRLLSILNTIPYGVYIVNQQYDIEYINPVIEREFGHVDGRKCYDYFHDWSEICPWCKNSKVFAGESVQWEWHSVKNDRHYDLFDTPIINADGSVSKLKIFHDITGRKKTEEKLNAAFKEKEILLKEVNHRVKNNMQAIISMIRLQYGHINNQKLTDILKVTENRIRSMARIHEILYQSNDFANVNIKNYLNTLVEELFQSYQLTPEKITLKTDIENISIQLNHALPLAMLVNELITNTFKYAFPKDKTGELSISLKHIDSDLELIVKDNGVGIPKNVELNTRITLGLKMVNALVKQIGGKMEMKCSQGTEFLIRF